MKFGFRIPSLKKRITARTSPARFIRHSLGLKAPRGWGWLTNPKRAAYNRIYNRTTFGCLLPALLALLLVAFVASLALAGNTSSLYNSQGSYAGRIVQHPGSNSASVYDAQGRYQGRIVTQQDGRQDVYNPTGHFEGSTRPDHVQVQPQHEQDP